MIRAGILSVVSDCNLALEQPYIPLPACVSLSLQTVCVETFKLKGDYSVCSDWLAVHMALPPDKAEPILVDLIPFSSRRPSRFVILFSLTCWFYSPPTVALIVYWQGHAEEGHLHEIVDKCWWGETMKWILKFLFLRDLHNEIYP